MNQQTVVLVHYPYTHFEQTKLRPAIILSNDEFNHRHAFCILCPITSQQTLSEYETLISQGEFSGKLKTTSYIRCDNLMSVDKGMIIDEIGKISPSLFKQVVEKAQKNFN